MFKLFYLASLSLIFVAANASAQQKKNSHAGTQHEMKMKYSSPSDISTGTYSKVNPGVVKSKSNADRNTYKKNKKVMIDSKRVKKLNRVSSHASSVPDINLFCDRFSTIIYRKNDTNQFVSFS
jgi:hypothetical protein